MPPFGKRQLRDRLTFCPEPASRAGQRLFRGRPDVCQRVSLVRHTQRTADRPLRVEPQRQRDKQRFGRRGQQGIDQADP